MRYQFVLMAIGFIVTPAWQLQDIPYPIGLTQRNRVSTKNHWLCEYVFTKKPPPVACGGKPSRSAGSAFWLRVCKSCPKTEQNHLVFQQSSAVTPQQVYAQQLRFDPNSAYTKKSIRGFSVWINRRVFQHKQAAQEMLKELDSQLLQITRVVPPKPLSALKKVRIWVEWEKQNGAAEFHPSATWLRQNGYNPDKAGSVEISNTRNFVNWSRTDQPWMILHELAHAYHILVFGDSNSGIEAVYQQAVASRLYESVYYIKGGKRKAYALTNAKEYFAELSEAYFGKNDFYPFTHTQLKKHDPVGYQMMEQVWGKPIKTKG